MCYQDKNSKSAASNQCFAMFQNHFLDIEKNSTNAMKNEDLINFATFDTSKIMARYSWVGVVILIETDVSYEISVWSLMFMDIKTDLM